MSIKSAPYYWVECDLCGAPLETSEYTAWQAPDQAEDEAYYSAWHIQGGNHLCYDCLPPTPDGDL